MNTNPILNTDSYKTSHWLQYPPGTQNVSSYIEARAGARFNEIVFFGLKWYLDQYLSVPFSSTNIDHAEKVILAHGLPFNRKGWQHILAKHGGYLPLEVKALPEGAVVPTGIPMVQVEATDPECAWLVSYIETALLRSVWYGTTVATYSREVKKVIKSNLDLTCDDPSNVIDFMLHDFGARGASSNESAILGGMAHLINFKGTDTLSTIQAVDDLYHIFPAGFSVPAAEHSTITSWGRDQELAAYLNMIEQFDHEGGIVSIVADSYDLWAAVRDIFAGDLKERILNMRGRLVIRPDSGDPVEVVTKLVTVLDTHFGSTVNGKGYKVLNPKVRVLQGDGVNLVSVGEVLKSVTEAGYSGENVVFGMGGALLQDHTRDELRFAMKANAIQDGNGEWQDVFKKPATDPTKSSKAGRQIVAYDPQRHQWASAKLTDANAAQDRLQTVYADGVVTMEDDFEAIRKRAEIA